jgi:hypothetical protein
VAAALVATLPVLEDNTPRLDDVCAMCYLPMELGVEELSLTACGHVLHRQCLGQWVAMIVTE